MQVLNGMNGSDGIVSGELKSGDLKSGDLNWLRLMGRSDFFIHGYPLYPDSQEYMSGWNQAEAEFSPQIDLQTQREYADRGFPLRFES